MVVHTETLSAIRFSHWNHQGELRGIGRLYNLSRLQAFHPLAFSERGLFEGVPGLAGQSLCRWYVSVPLHKLNTTAPLKCSQHRWTTPHNAYIFLVWNPITVNREHLSHWESSAVKALNKNDPAMFSFQSNITIFLGSPRGYHLLTHSHTGFFEWFLLTDLLVEIPYTAASVNFEGLVKAIKYTNWDPAFFYRYCSPKGPSRISFWELVSWL